MNEEEKTREQQEREAREAVKCYLGYFIRKATRAAGEATAAIEMADCTGYDWIDIWRELMELSRIICDADRNLDYALKTAEEHVPPPEFPTPDEIIAMEKNKLAKPKKPEAKKVPAKREEVEE